MTCENVNARKCAACKLGNAVEILNKLGDREIGVAITQISLALDILARAVVNVDWENILCMGLPRGYWLCNVCPLIDECHRIAEEDLGCDMKDSFWAKEGDCFGLHPAEGLFVPQCYQICTREEACKAETLRRARK